MLEKRVASGKLASGSTFLKASGLQHSSPYGKRIFLRLQGCRGERSVTPASGRRLAPPTRASGAWGPFPKITWNWRGTFELKVSRRGLDRVGLVGPYIEVGGSILRSRGFNLKIQAFDLKIQAFDLKI